MFGFWEKKAEKKEVRSTERLPGYKGTRLCAERKPDCSQEKSLCNLWQGGS